ncbi:MAG: hypothetical protein E6560_10705 [Yersiniaceae bacterium]|nr:hypothetical protein [Yersiniaceae bacterium]
MTNKELLPAIRWPIPKNNRGDKFIHLEEVLSHLEGESSGHWLIGSQGMWHGGLHITDATTPWCALSGHAAHEAIDYPLPYRGEQPICCMADGEVIAYRINRDYLSVPWETGDRFYSGSFVLVRHYIQPGKTKESGLTFYTLYMHLAPWLAYPEQENTTFKVTDGQHLNAYVDASLQWTVAQLKPGTRVTWDKTAKSDTIIGANGRQYSCVTLDEPVNGSMILKAGDRVWTLSDNNNLVPVGHSPIRPGWWSSLLPPSRNVMQFDSVECPTPYPIKAGDAIGHMGWYQALKDGGHKKRYQVHIECLATGDLPRFLSNPEGVEQDRPAFARCPAGIPIYLKDSAGKIRDSNVKTLTEKVISLSGQAIKDVNRKRYWPGGTSRGLLAESDLRLLSQYDLAERGFGIIEDSPASFDHLDGKTKPRGLVRSIFQRFFNVADNDGQLGSQIVAFNYQQLVNNIDTPTMKWYEPEQYRRAVHHSSMRDHLHRLCVRHPSEWYFSTEAPVWKQYLSWDEKRGTGMAP